MQKYLSLIAFSHTIFALPFALVGFAIGTQEVAFSIPKLVGVLCCMVFARSAAMAFNRYIDRDIDAMNPRTAVREIPSGAVEAKNALFLVVFCSFGLIFTTYFINPLCFWLSPIALLVTLGYSLTKRFTALCHVVLGMGLSLAPIGAYMAVTGRGDYWLPWAFSAVVLLWVAGFDIIYALQDEEFDKSLSLNSIPVWLGTKNALHLSNALHLICASIMGGIAYFSNLGWLNGIGVLFFFAMLFYQHTLVKPNDLSRIDRAFFTTNGIASVVYGCFALADMFFLF
jgi:4-hydroxybenzoate polyprenyltransferase